MNVCARFDEINSDQPWHLLCLISPCIVNAGLLQADIKDYQTGQMTWLIRVFAGAMVIPLVLLPNSSNKHTLQLFDKPYTHKFNSLVYQGIIMPRLISFCFMVRNHTFQHEICLQHFSIINFQRKRFGV